jgi:iron complex outermembrane recepter protein
MGVRREMRFAALISLRLATTLCVSLCLGAGVQAESRRVYELDVAAQSLATALNEFSAQTGLPVVFPFELTRGKTSSGIRGRYMLREALDALLAGTGLSGGLSDKGVLTISSPAIEQTPGETHVIQKPRRAAVATFFASLAASINAPAQNPTAGQEADRQVEEVIVSARKREERLQDVPASIAAASGETLAGLNIVSVAELDMVAPGLTIATNPSRFGTGPTIAVRGISTQTQSIAIEDSVGIVIDGVPISRAKAGSFPDLSDIERVEVLRGPQGTLFGMNASAGVISLTTKDPTNAFESELSLDYGTYDSRTLSAIVSGALIEDKLLGRLSAYDKSRDGFVENIFDGSEWEADDQTGARGKLILLASPSDTFKLSGDFTEQKNDAGANIIRGFTAVTPQYVRNSLASIAGPENDRINARPLGNNRQRAGGASLQWDHEFGDYTLTSIAAYRSYDQNAHAGTYTWLTPLNEGEQFFRLGFDQYSGEMRLASPTGRRLEYVVGAFLLDNKIDSFIHDPSTLLVQNGTRFGRHAVSGADTLNYAAFGEANLNVTDRFTVTAGLRWTHEDVSVGITGLPIAAGLSRIGHPLGTTEDSASVDKVSWRAGAQWQFADDKMLYASGSTGFKGPAFNNNTSILGNAQETRSEVSTSFEAGLKSEFLNRRVRFNFGVYHTEFKDFQTQGGLFLPGSPLSQIVLLNAGRLVTKGVETDIAASLGESTEIILNAAYTDATFKEYRNAPCYPGAALTIPSCATNGVQDLTGTRLANTPEWNVNFIAQQELAIPRSTWRAFGALDYSWRGSVQWHNLGSPAGIEGAYGLLGASLGIRSDNDRLRFKVYGKNLTDKFHTSGIAVGEQIMQFVPPDYRRIVGAEAVVRF